MQQFCDWLLQWGGENAVVFVRSLCVCVCVSVDVRVWCNVHALPTPCPSANTTTALIAPWQYPRPGTPGQFLVGLSYLDYCPAITAYSNGDCQDSSLTPSGTNYYGFVYSVSTCCGPRVHVCVLMC